MDYKYIDIGVNLINRQFKSDLSNVLADAEKEKVGMIITGTDMRSNIESCNLIKNSNYSGLWSTCGIHPHNADKWDEVYKSHMIQMLDKHNCIKAIGEIGLDYDRMYSKKESQLKCFDEVLSLAEGYKYPLFLHEREAVDDFFRLLKSHRKLCSRAVVHCFTGTEDTVYKYLNLGCYIGITGWICDDRRNKDLLKAVKRIPISRLMVETDAPYLTPKGLGLVSRNVPINVKYVVDKIAEVKLVSAEEVREKTLQNTINIFGI